MLTALASVAAAGGRARRAALPPSRGLASEELAAVDTSLDMGCSLCSLRKPEEQYRLLYEVCQVTWLSLPLRPGGAPPRAGGPPGEGSRDAGGPLAL